LLLRAVQTGPPAAALCQTQTEAPP
jgi:hypothetical protein